MKLVVQYHFILIINLHQSMEIYLQLLPRKKYEYILDIEVNFQILGRNTVATGALLILERLLYVSNQRLVTRTTCTNKTRLSGKIQRNVPLRNVGIEAPYGIIIIYILLLKTYIFGLQGSYLFQQSQESAPKHNSY